MIFSNDEISLFLIAGFIALGLIFWLCCCFLYWFFYRRSHPAPPHLWGRQPSLSNGPTADPKAELTELESLIPESHFIEVNGTRLHYVQAGEGRDIVFLHGIGASLYIWRYLFPFMLAKSRYRMTAFDLAGFGQSCKDPKRDYGLDAQTELIAEALRKIGIETAFLVGSSMGGAVALWLAKRHPERFSRVATLAPATDSRLAPAHVHHFAPSTRILRKALNRKTMRLILQRVLARRELITDEVIDAYLNPFIDQGDGVQAFWSATKLLSDKRLPGELHDIRSRVLIVYGECDLMVPRKSIDLLMRKIADASLLLHPHGGHHIMEDEPAWVAEALENFFERP